MAKEKTKKRKTGRRRTVAKCGLCGATDNLIKTECCDQWICDDEDQYVMFSYARNSCYRNHSRFTLCGYHHVEDHPGDWKNCPKCREDIETEMYVYFGTNEYNFEKLKNPPAYQPKKCSQCGSAIVVSEGGYSQRGDEYWCAKCTAKDFPSPFLK
ncbi:MAG: hypothetical protein GY869_27320 [Planctomycetes bacterium]|nr:hypothetical protein [Planctomycetota bacterium]